MYLTRRENGYRYQRRIPKDLELILGKTPIRIHLGCLSARKASWIARLLASHSDRLFLDVLKRGDKSMSEDADPRDTLIAELQTLVAELMDDVQQTTEMADQVIGQQELLHSEDLERLANELKVAAFERENAIRRDVNDVDTSFIGTQARVLNALQIAKSNQKSESPDAVAPELKALSDKIASLNAAVQTTLDGGCDRPLMSVALDKWHHEIRLQQGIAEKKTGRIIAA